MKPTNKYLARLEEFFAELTTPPKVPEVVPSDETFLDIDALEDEIARLKAENLQLASALSIYSDSYDRVMEEYGQLVLRMAMSSKYN